MMRRLTIGVVVVLVLAGAAVADRLRPSTAPLPAADVSDAPGGVWACPVVKGAGTGGWLHLVNSGTKTSRVRVSFLPDGGKPVEQTLALASMRVATLPTPVSIAKVSAGAIVEFAGGAVTVSRTVMLTSQGVTGAAAAACARPGSAGLVVPLGGTLRAETQVALLNPGTADALVDIALLAGGEKIEPESLQRRIVPARGRLVIREGDFAFDEPSIAAQIVARSGRVLADGVLLGPRLLEISPAQTAAREFVVVGSTARGAAVFSSVVVGDDDAVASGSVLSGTGQTAFAPFINGLAPNTPIVDASATSDVPPGAVALTAKSETTPIAIAARWQIAQRRVGAEWAVSSGVFPSRDIVLVMGTPGAPAGMRLLLANPDPEQAIVDLTVITASGATRPAGLQRLSVPAGRTATIPMTGTSRSAPIAIVLTVRGGRVAAVLEAVAAIPGAFSAFAVTGTPVAGAPVVAIEPDPLQGVPAQ